MRQCGSNFCQALGEASDLTTNAHVASALDVYSAHTERMHRANAQSPCWKKPTNAQHVGSARKEWLAHAALDMRYKHAGCAPGVCWRPQQKNMQRISSVCSAHVCVHRACTLMRRAPRTFFCMHKNPDTHSEWRRIHSVDPARSTNE